MVTTEFAEYAVSILIMAVCAAAPAYSTNKQELSVSDHGYRNPILFSDYSDPDVIRNGNHFYLIASTFNFAPGIPILESLDLVHWTILGHALPRLYSYTSMKDVRSISPGLRHRSHFSFWKGSRPALFAYTERPDEAAAQSRTDSSHDGWIDFDWAHYRPLR